MKNKKNISLLLKKHSLTPPTIPEFYCLNGNDVIAEKVSDHHPVVHDDAIYWNIMMQGNIRKQHKPGTVPSYNNAFGIIESDTEYKTRLVKVASVISELVLLNPEVKVIGLCEGPIQREHTAEFIKALKKHKGMGRFIQDDKFYQPEIDKAPNWGLLMLADSDYTVNCIPHKLHEPGEWSKQLAGRLQLWELNSARDKRVFSLAHFPYSSDVFVSEKTKLSVTGSQFGKFLHHLLTLYQNTYFTLCADFNFNPYLISEWSDRVVDKIPADNSVLRIDDSQSSYAIQPVTVDAILLSQRQKQRFLSKKNIFNLFTQLTKEFGFFRKNINNLIEELNVNADPVNGNGLVRLTISV